MVDRKVAQTYLFTFSDFSEAGDTPTTDKYENNDAQAVLNRILAEKAEKQAKDAEEQK
jgi:hypothetical protein